MLVKTIRRNIPPERENAKDNFRVQYNNKFDFELLKVIIKRDADNSIQEFEFDSDNLPDNDSIHFTTSVQDDKLIVKWRGEVEPLLIAEPTIIELKPEWFKSGYYVYIVVIEYEQQKYFYIGMTGDRKYQTARSPFYRMGGHFNQLESSTQNQIVKGIRKKLGIADVEAVLTEMKFTYYCYLIEAFDKNDSNLHKIKRNKAEKIESYLIEKFRNQFTKEFVFNKNVSVKDSKEAKDIAEQIYSNFITKINITDA